MNNITITIIAIVSFAVYSLGIWFLGMWARHNIIGQRVSWLVISASMLALAGMYFVRPCIGHITITVKPGGHVSNITDSDLYANIDLKKYNQKGDIVSVWDDRAREFFSSVPKNIKTANIRIHLSSVNSFLLGSTFLIFKIPATQNYYVIFTWGKLAAFLISSFAIFSVWMKGNEGKFSFLALESDD